MHKIFSVGKLLTTYNVAMHTHDYWEIVYCTSGSGQFSGSGGTYIDYSQGEVIAIPPGIEHSNISTHGFTNIHLIMDDIALPKDSFIKIIDNPSQILYHSVSQVYYLYNSETADKDNLISILAELIGNCLVNFVGLKQLSPQIKTIYNDIIKNFTDLNFNLKKSFENKASNPEYLRKLFKKEIGVTAHQFLTDTRIEYAKKLLKYKIALNKNIGEIARECGFEDALYFSRIFKKRVGCSPYTYFEKNKVN